MYIQFHLGSDVWSLSRSLNRFLCACARCPCADVSSPRQSESHVIVYVSLDIRSLQFGVLKHKYSLMYSVALVASLRYGVSTLMVLSGARPLFICAGYGNKAVEGIIVVPELS